MFNNRSRTLQLGTLATLTWSLVGPGCGRADESGLTWPCGSTDAGGRAGGSGGKTFGGSTPASNGPASWAGSSDAGAGGNEGGATFGGAGAFNGGAQGEGDRSGATSGRGGAGSAIGGEGGTLAIGGAGGVGGEGGQFGPEEAVPCEDGCVLLYVPFRSASETQFFTINLDLIEGIDLRRAVVTARLRTVGYDGEDHSIKLYASALPASTYWGGAPTVNLSALSGESTLTLDLTDTPGWDNSKVTAFGFQLGGSPAGPVWIVVEEITITEITTFGPWPFELPKDVNPLQDVLPGYSTPNVLFVNPLNQVAGARAIWIPPSGSAGVGGGGT